MSEKYGIDVSTAQGVIDWDKLAANDDLSFVIIRAAQGLFQDSRFERNIKEVLRVGLPFGLYFAASAKTEADAATEANFANEYGTIYRPQYGLWYDMELSTQKVLGKTAVSAMLRTWLEHVKASGNRCGIYTNKDWLDNRIDHELLNEYDLWYAAYPSTARKALTDAPRDNREKLSYPMSAIWQWSSAGRIDGINGNVDLNVCYETFTDKGAKDKGYVSVEKAKEILENLGYSGIVL